MCAEAPGSHQLAQTRQASRGKATVAAEPGGTGSGATGRSAWQGTKTNSGRKTATSTANPLFSRPLSSSASGADEESEQADVASLGSKLFSKLHNITPDNSNHGSNAAAAAAKRTISATQAPDRQQQQANKGNDDLHTRGFQPDEVQATPQRHQQQQQQQRVMDSTMADATADVDEIHLDLRNNNKRSQPSGLTPLGSFLRVMGAGLAPFRSWSPANTEHDAVVPGASDTDTGTAAIVCQAEPAATQSTWDGDHTSSAKQDSVLQALHCTAQDMQAAKTAVGVVESLLMWHNPWASARVMGAGLYSIVCMSQLTAGTLPITPATLLLGCAFLLLMVNLTRLTIWRVKYHRANSGRHPHTTQITDVTDDDNQQQQQQLSTPSGRHTDSLMAKWGMSAGSGGSFLHRMQSSSHGGASSTTVSPSMQHAMDEEARVYAAAHAVLARAACMLVPALAGAAALVYRALSGRRLASSALTAGCLWLGMLLGELHLVSSAWFAAALWVALFSVPCAYVRSRAAADHLVEDLLRMAAGLLVHSERSTLLAAGACCASLLVWGPAALIARVTTAMAVGFAVLLYPHVAAAACARTTGAARVAAAAEQHGATAACPTSSFSVTTAPAASEEEEEGARRSKGSNSSSFTNSKLPPLPLSRASTISDASRRVPSAKAAAAAAM